MMCRYFSIGFFLLSLLTPLSSQIKEDFFITYGFAFPSGGYLSIRYYPVDKIGVEIYSSAFWNIFNYGVKINIHSTTSLPHTFISIGYSHITAFNPYILSDTSVGRVIYLSRLVEGIDLGIGRDVDYDNKHFSFQLGPTYIVNLKDSFFNEHREIETFESPVLFSYFFVGTMLAQLPEKNPKPVYVK
jgi:hypothetical protein